MILEFDGIQFSHDERTLLTGIYMKCAVGSVTGLLGRNGSGKSTLLKLAFGSLRTELISVRINQKPIDQPSFTSRQIAYLPQDSFVPDELTLRQILKLYEVPENKIFHSFPELREDILKSAGQLSGGRLRLFEVLLILNSKVSFCLLDEPFTGLTPLWIERLVDYINEIKSSKGIILSDHLYRQVVGLSDSLYLLTNGKTYLIKNEMDLIHRGYLPDHE
jgi:ABC-type multidrug transport system ATPase subunit